MLREAWRFCAITVGVFTLTATTVSWASESGAATSPTPSTLAAALKTPGTTWYRDPSSGHLTVTFDDTVTNEAQERLRTETNPGGAVTIIHQPGVLARRSGGSAVHSGGVACSVGFSGHRGEKPYFITAGHCGKQGARWYSADNKLIGIVVTSSFPAVDYALVAYAPTAERANVVDLGNGKVQDISHAGTARVGQRVTRKGQETGVRSGIVTAVHVTVNYPEGTVTGLIKTDICAEDGDSGGPLFRGTAGLGLLSGGEGDCRTGGVTYYQPIQPALEKLGIELY